MPKNKFIDKKNSETFRVVHRSQRDLEKLENDNEASNLVLTPMKTDSKTEGPKIDLPKEVLPGKEVEDVKIPFMPRPELFMEVDEEIERALENPDDDDWEELDDDFVAQANIEQPDYVPKKRAADRNIWEDNEDEDDDNYDEEREEDPNDWDEDIDEEAAKYLKNPPKRFLEMWKKNVQFADADDNIQKTEKVDLSTIKDESRKMLEARFEKTLNMYDDDEIGELDDADPHVHGTVDINLFEDVLDDFIHKTTKFTLNDFTTEELANTSIRSVKQKTLIIPSIGHWDETHQKHSKKKNQQIIEEDEEEDLDDIDDYQPNAHEQDFEDDEDDEEYEEEQVQQKSRRQPQQFDDAEDSDPEKRIEAMNKTALKSQHNEADLERYVLESDSEGEQKEWISIHQEDEHWDCQSILSTYSNTDNHPKLIVEDDKKQKIKLSQKTGLPVGVLKGKKQEKEKKSAADLGVARPQGETKEEKKLRKQLVKQQRQQSREKKKILKTAYKNEELNQKYLMNQVPPPTIKL